MENQMTLAGTARQSGFGVPTAAGPVGFVRPLPVRVRSGKQVSGGRVHGVDTVDAVTTARPTTLGLPSSAPPIT